MAGLALSNGLALKACIKGPWTVEEDSVLAEYVSEHGEGKWNLVQQNTGLRRCGKSCRLRWANHLRPYLKRGPITEEEEALIVRMHNQIGNKWAKMAAQLPGRTDNEIKNFFNTRAKRRFRAGLPFLSEGQPTSSLSPLSTPQIREACSGLRAPGSPSQFTASSLLSPLSNQTSVPFAPIYLDAQTNPYNSSPRKALRSSLNSTPTTSSLALEPMADLGAINQLFSAHPPGCSSWGGAKGDWTGPKPELVHPLAAGQPQPQPQPQPHPHPQLQPHRAAMIRSPSCISSSGMNTPATTLVNLQRSGDLAVTHSSEDVAEKKNASSGGVSRSRIQQLKRARDQALAKGARGERASSCASDGDLFGGAVQVTASTLLPLPRTSEHGTDAEVGVTGSGWAAGPGRELMKLLDDGPTPGPQIRSQMGPCHVEGLDLCASPVSRMLNPPHAAREKGGSSSPFLGDFMEDISRLRWGNPKADQGRFLKTEVDNLSPTNPFCLTFLDDSPYTCDSETDDTLLESMLQEASVLPDQPSRESPFVTSLAAKLESASGSSPDFLGALLEEGGVAKKFPRFASCRQLPQIALDEWMEAYDTSLRKTNSS